jgi:hypothetical protein
MTTPPNTMQKLATNCGDPGSVKVSAVPIAHLPDSAHLDGLQDGIAARDRESVCRSAADLVEAFPGLTLGIVGRDTGTAWRRRLRPVSNATVVRDLLLLERAIGRFKAAMGIKLDTSFEIPSRETRFLSRERTVRVPTATKKLGLPSGPDGRT